MNQPTPLEFFGLLQWLDGRPLMDTIEDYRREIFQRVLFSFGDDGRLRYNQALLGRGKKNWKSCDLVLAALYRLLVWNSPDGQNNDAYIVANDQEQALDDLDLAKKIIEANPILADEVVFYAEKIVRKDMGGALQVLAVGGFAAPSVHGKTFGFVGFDEIHGMKDYSILEALSPDPTRHDVITWITSYAGPIDRPGIPICDLFRAGCAGTDPRMYFSWYSGAFTTDPPYQSPDLTPEARANPSMASWGNDGYLTTQKARLPSAQYRRLHLNEPGPKPGAAFSPDAIDTCIPKGIKIRGRHPTARHFAFVDLSGGSQDDAVLAISHWEPASDVPMLDLIACQPGGAIPFNPRFAVSHFCALLGEYGISQVTGDAFGGDTFKADFAAAGRIFQLCPIPAYELYENLEIRLNTETCTLLDHPKLRDQLLGLRISGVNGRIAHAAHEHDDWANAAAGAIWLARPTEAGPESHSIVAPVLVGEHMQRYEAVGGRVSGYMPTGYRWDQRDY